MKKYSLNVKVIEIKGRCPVYEIGDCFIIKEGFKLVTEKTLCMHSLSSLIPYYVSLSRGIKPEELGLGTGNKAYIQCLDPCKYTGGGTVIFEINIL